MRLLPLLLLLAIPLFVHAEDWTTTDGKTYHGVKVLSHDAAFVTVMDADGGARIPLRTLDANLQKKFDYDATKAAITEAAITAADTRHRQELIKEEQQQTAAAAQARQVAQQPAPTDAAAPRDKPPAPSSTPSSKSAAEADRRKTLLQPNAYFGISPNATPASENTNLSVIYNHLDFSNDLTTEWLVADDWDGTHLKVPDHVIIYLLVPPTVTKHGDHWEITFASSGRKKKVLSQHPNAAQFIGSAPFAPTARTSYTLALDHMGGPPLWLMIKSKETWAGQHVQPNADPLHTGSLYAFNLDPDDALGVAFLEPIITEKNDEWCLTTAKPTPSQLEDVAKAYDDWMKNHPEPVNPIPPELRYSPKLQKKYEAYLRARDQWVQNQNRQGLLPNLDAYLGLTLDQSKQNDAWRRAESAWNISGGEGPFPQPIDFIEDAPDPASP